MKCDKKYIIADLIQNRLSLDESERLKEHIMNCRICNTEYQELSQLFTKLNQEKLPEPTEIYWNNLLPNIYKRLESKNANKFLKYIPQVAFSVVILVIFSLLIVKIYNYSSDKIISLSNQETISLLDSLQQDDILEFNENLIINQIDSLNGIDNFVLNNILLTSNQIEELYQTDILISNLKEEEINYLLSYLSEEQINER